MGLKLNTVLAAIAAGDLDEQDVQAIVSALRAHSGKAVTLTPLQRVELAEVSTARILTSPLRPIPRNPHTS